MKKSKLTEQQIAFILKQADDGASVEDTCRKAGISIQTYYRWRQKYGGLMPSEMKRLRQLEDENTRLKRLVANLSLDKEMLQDVIRRKCQAWPGPAARGLSVPALPDQRSAGMPSVSIGSLDLPLSFP